MLASYAKWYSFTPPHWPNMPPPLTRQPRFNQAHPIRRPRPAPVSRKWVVDKGLTHPGRSRDGWSALGRSVGRGLGRHRLRAVAGPGLLVPRVVGEAHLHLDDQALILGVYPVAGAGPSLDVGSAGDPLVGEDGVLQAVRVVYFRSVGDEGLAHPGRSPDHR